MISFPLSTFLPIFTLSMFSFHPSYSSLVVNIHLSHNLINTICKDTQNYEFCMKSLDDYSPAREARTMHELGIITVLLATAQARVNKYVVDDLLHNEQDQLTKDRLTNCLSDYTVTMGKLRGAYRLSDAKDYKGMIKLVNDAMKMTLKCKNRFEKPPSRPFPIADDNQKMVWSNDIALVVLGLLDD